MIRQCCVCKKVFRDGKWVALVVLDTDSEDITHGYCDDCADELKASVLRVHALLDHEPVTTLSSRY
jgi:hypothetical protein